MSVGVNQLGATVDYYDFAEGSQLGKKDPMRKPNTGMGNLAASIITQATGKEINWAESFMVGDSGWKQKSDKDNPELDPSARK